MRYIYYLSTSMVATTVKNAYQLPTYVANNFVIGYYSSKLLCCPESNYAGAISFSENIV